jgi:lysine 2,3-aminomutase
VTSHYLSLADPRDPSDPVLAQCLPSAEEERRLGEGDDDPLDEAGQSPVPRLVHRYPDRVLLLATGRCFVHCRHCNRRRFWRDPPPPIGPAEMEAVAGYLGATPGVREVIVSGGDPLTLTDGELDRILGGLRALPGIEAVRIHTRAPVVQPARVTRSLQRVLRRHRPIWVNTQFNHPREVSPAAAEACGRILDAGCPLGNQTVLLRGVNDDPALIRDLLRGLQRIGVRPYYLFLCDQVRGAGHFRTGLGEALAIMESLRGNLPGLAIPHLAVDTPGGGGKVVLLPEALLSYDGGRAVLRNHRGRIFTLVDPADPSPGAAEPVASSS